MLLGRYKLVLNVTVSVNFLIHRTIFCVTYRLRDSRANALRQADCRRFTASPTTSESRDSNKRCEQRRVRLPGSEGPDDLLQEDPGAQRSHDIAAAVVEMEVLTQEAILACLDIDTDLIARAEVLESPQPGRAGYG